MQLTQVLTEGSFDAIMWQTPQRKAEFIDQIMSGKIQGSEIDDIGGSDTVLSFAEFKAISSGNPLLLHLANAGRDVQRLRRLYTLFGVGGIDDAYLNSLVDRLLAPRHPTPEHIRVSGSTTPKTRPAGS